jgi:hypothetical protein
MKREFAKPEEQAGEAEIPKLQRQTVGIEDHQQG